MLALNVGHHVAHADVVAVDDIVALLGLASPALGVDFWAGMRVTGQEKEKYSEGTMYGDASRIKLSLNQFTQEAAGGRRDHLQTGEGTVYFLFGNGKSNAWRARWKRFSIGEQLFQVLSSPRFLCKAHSVMRISLPRRYRLLNGLKSDVP